MDRPKELIAENPWRFLSGGGEMDTLTRAYDWARHPLGPPEGWLATLKSTLGIVLANRFPMFIFWGAELHCFYNDAYRPSLGKEGKHPFILGMPAAEAWPEIWDIIKPLIDQVMSGAGGTWSEDQLIPIYRNGHIEDVYWTFSYSPIADAQGAIHGVLVTCAETTGKVLSLKALEEGERQLSLEVAESVLARQKAEAGEAQFRLLADSMPQFIWTGDAQGNLNYFNRSMYDYTGVSEERLMKEGWPQIVHPDDLEKNEARWMAAIATGSDFLFEHRFMRHDGEYRWQLSRAIPLRNADGSVRMWVGTSTDIQDIKQQDEQKDYFISMASHELRNPLSALRGYVEVLKMEYGNSTDELMRSALSSMDRQVTTLTDLINGLLDVSKMRAGVVALERAPFKVGELVRAVIEEMERTNPGHRIEYSGEDVILNADRGRIAQVLTNLLTNAVKYAPGSNHISVNSRVEEQRIFVSVRDRGIGISQRDQQRVFERFYRVAGRDEHTYAGFGIGLSLAADIIRLHSGDIGVTSEPGKGSTFWFALPI